MSKENSDNSPFYWLNMCEGVSERITDLLDADVHRPGEGADTFRNKTASSQTLSWRPHFETCTRNYRKRLNS